MARSKRADRARRPASLRVVYKTRCTNPGCGHAWNVTVTRDDLSALASKLVCPGCSRSGGQLRSEGRLTANSRTAYYRASLVFPTLDSLRGDLEDALEAVAAGSRR